MTLSREYQDKFDTLKQRFNCSDSELETLLKETYKSGKGYNHGSLENLIDYQIHQIDSPRRRISQVVYSPIERQRRKIKKPENERLSAREIRELFGTHTTFSRKNQQNHQRIERLRKTAIRSKKKAIKKMLREGRQKLLGYGTRQTRMGALLNRLGNEGRTELANEGRRLIRRQVRSQIRRIVPLY